MSRLFISHSSKNDDWGIALRDWLVREGWASPDDIFLDLDPERGIAAGERWAKALEDAATRCEAVLVLVSEAWLASKWCADEYQLANKYNKKLFALLIEDIALERLPGGLAAQWQIVRLRGEPAERFLTVHPLSQTQSPIHIALAGLTSLKRGLERAGIATETFELQPDPASPFGWRSPYRGLEAYEPEDAAVFFGRNADIVRGIDTLRGLAAQSTPRLLVVLGASGAGKSSFLRAGLWPRLARDDAQWLPLRPIRAGRGGAIEGSEGLLSAMEEVSRRIGRPVSRAELRARLATPEEFVQFLRDLRQAAARRALLSQPPFPLPVLCLDQAEELYGTDSGAEAPRLLEFARTAMQRGEILVLSTIRSDAYGQMQSAPTLAGIHQVTLSLGPVPQGEIGRVIREPSEVLRRRAGPTAPVFDATVVERLQSEIEGEADALPLLAFVLQRLMREHITVGTIGLTELAQTGGVTAAIEAEADAALADAGVPPDNSVRREILRRLFIPRLARVNRDSKTAQRRVARQSELPPDLLRLAQALTQRRLLVVKLAADAEGPAGHDIATLEVAHEALLRRWPTLAELLAQDRDALLLLDGLLLAATDWEKADPRRKPDYLSHRGTRLADGLALSLRGPDWERELRPVRTYLAACQSREETERTAERERTEREKAQIAETQAAQAEREIALSEREAAREREAKASRRVVRRTVGGLVAALVLAVTAIAFGYYAYLKRGEAEGQRAGAVASEQQAVAAQTAALKSRDDALLTQSKFLAEAALQAIDRDEPVTAALLALEALPDQSSKDEIKRTRPYWAPAEVALESALRFIRERVIINRHRVTVQSVAMTPDGSRIVSGSYGEVHVWNGATGAEIARLNGEIGKIDGVGITADGSRIVTGGTTADAVAVWDANTGDRIVPIPEGIVRTIAITADVATTPDGSRVVRAVDRTVRIWRAGADEPMVVLQGHDDLVTCVAVTADGSRIFSGSMDNTVRVWDGNTGTQLAVLTGHKGTVTRIAIIGDGGHIVTSSTDETARIWDTSSGKELAVLKGHEREIWSVAATQDGSRIVTGAGQEIADGKKRENTVRIWSGKFSPEILRFEGHTNAVSAIALMPDARRVISAASDNTNVISGRTSDFTARIWDIGTGVELRVLRGHTGAINGIAVTPNGSRIITASSDKTVRVWDPQTGEPLFILGGYEKDVRSVVAARDGERVITGSSDGILRVWNVNTGAELRTFQLNGWISSLALLPDDQRIAVGMADGTHVLEIATGAEQMVLKEKNVWRLAAFPDGTRILTGSNATDTVRIWNVQTGEQVGQLNGFIGTPESIVVTPDGTRILTASSHMYYPYRTFSVWDAGAGVEIARIRGHAGDINAIALTADARQAITGSNDKTVRVWELFEPGQTLIERAKTLSPRCLSPEERQKYFLPAEPPSWCTAQRKFPYDRRSIGQQLIERGEKDIQINNYQLALASFGEAVAELDQTDPNVLAEAYFGRGRANDGLHKYAEAIADFQKAQELGNANAGNWLWWSTKRLSEQKLADGSAVESLLISLHNYLNLTPTVRTTIELDDLRTESNSIAYPLGVLHGDLTAASASGVTDCDRSAAQGYDPLRVAPGVALTQIDAATVITVCSAAIERNGRQGRLLLQRSRANAKAAADARSANDVATANAHHRAQFDDLADAMSKNYPYAFNNMGLMYQNGESVAKDLAKSAALTVEFVNRVIECCTARVARKLRDAESQHGKAIVEEVVGALLGWAAELGSAAAHEALASWTLNDRPTSLRGIDPRADALMHYRVAAQLSAAGGDAAKARELSSQADEAARGLSADAAADAESRARTFTKAPFIASPPWLQ